MTYRELEQLFAKRRISRRQFLQGAAALGAVSLASGVLGPSAFASSGGGGRLRVGIGHGSSGDSLDPATFENDFTRALAYAHHNYICEITADGDVAPELAESWETDDAKTWVVHLRRGVEFHNGREMTADDVIASFNHHRGDDTVSAASVLLEPVVEIRKDDDYTVVFQLEDANADFMFICADDHIAIKPANDNGTIDATDGIGAGPYVLRDFDPGVSASLERFGNYWKEGKPHFAEVELLSIHDQSARTNALMTDELDVIDSVDLATVHRLKEVPGIVVDESLGYRHNTFTMRTDTAPFDNSDVRLAVKYAVDRQQLIDTVLRGYGVRGNDHPVSPQNRFHAADLPQREYDPDRARHHLERAGLDRLEVTLHAANAAFDGAVDAAVLFQETAREAGIDINVVRAPDDGYWSDVWMVESFKAVYWSGRVTEDMVFSTTYSAGADWNDTFWEHDRFNTLLRQARAELDEDRRAEMYHEMQSILRDDGGAVIPMFENYVFARRDRVENDGDLAGNRNLDGMKFSERWWSA